MRNRPGRLLALLFLQWVMALAATQAAASGDLASEVRELERLLPGTYDNAEQAAAEAHAGLAKELRQGHRMQKFARVERPATCCTGFDPGPDAAFFYMQIFRDGVRWPGGDHIVVVYPDAALDTLVWQFVRVADPVRFADLDRSDVAKQRAVTLVAQPQDVLDCPVLGRKAGPGVFKAALKGGGCNVVSRVSGKERRLEMFLDLSSDRLLYMDRGIEKGVVMHGSVDGTPFRMTRVVAPR